MSLLELLTRGGMTQRQLHQQNPHKYGFGEAGNLELTAQFAGTSTGSVSLPGSSGGLSHFQASEQILVTSRHPSYMRMPLQMLGKGGTMVSGQCQELPKGLSCLLVES